MKTEYRHASATGLCELRVCRWDCDAPRAVVQLTHGMAEHIDRYDDFAAFLNAHGITVVGFDLPGHGQSVGEDKLYGYFGAERGWDKLILDMRTVYELTRAEHPDLPYVLFGHSMGSFLARTYAGRYTDGIDAFIFSGTAGPNPVLPVAKLIAKSEIKKNGAHMPSPKLDAMSFGAYNKPFAPARTAFDWLSRDTAHVDKYVEDPLCGFVFTAEGFRDLFDGLSEVNAKDWAGRVPKKPIMMLSGEDDPVGGKKASGVQKVAAALLQSGHDVLLMVYPGCRHEVLNETNNAEVYNDILDFINQSI